MKYENEKAARADGTTRKVHYGEGEQPWDTALRLGWAHHFAATNVLKYLRRAKDEEHSLESAKIYYEWLYELGIPNGKFGIYTQSSSAWFAFKDLNNELTTEEQAKLNG